MHQRAFGKLQPDRALDIRLRKVPAGALDQAATRRVVSALVRQGFDPGAVFKRLRKLGARSVDDAGD